MHLNIHDYIRLQQNSEAFFSTNHLPHTGNENLVLAGATSIRSAAAHDGGKPRLQ